jgi:trehalose-6-phosphate synthase
MNLVAKEYVATQDPDDPGVLVLSRITGAAIDMLRADRRNVEAEAALQSATRVDPTFADAWYNA